MPKLTHIDNPYDVRFITFSCYRRMPFLTSEKAKIVLAKRLSRSRFQNNFKLFAYVFMPEHVHLLLLPSDGTNVGSIIGEIKCNTTKEYFKENPVGAKQHHVLWQKRCYDHNCRTIEDVRVKIEYCHNNPVKSGLAPETAEYRWSGYNWYHGNKDVPLLLDEDLL